MMLRYAFLALALTLGTSFYTHAMDVTGDYTIEGSTTDGGGVYTGTLEIVKKGEVLQLTWHTGNGKFVGTGLLTKGVLSAVWRQGEDIGVSSFIVEEGKLVGTWAYLKTDGKRFKEVATKK
jgi:hypothetical protein